MLSKKTNLQGALIGILEVFRKAVFKICYPLTKIFPFIQLSNEKSENESHFFVFYRI